jgi:glycosyltransferase involved in cell wall biosynthesis
VTALQRARLGHNELPVSHPPRGNYLLVGPGFEFLGGVSVYTCRLANALAQRHDTSVLVLRRLTPGWIYPGHARIGRPLSNLDYDANVTILGQLDWYWGLPILQVLRRLGRNPPGVIVLQWWTAAALHTHLAIAAAGALLGVPVLIEIHEAQDTGEASIPFAAAYCRRFLPLLLSHAAGMVVHNSQDLEMMRRRFGSSIDHLAVEMAPHGPYEHLKARAEQSPEPCDSSVTQLLFFGLIRPYKGLEDLLAAFNQMSPEQAGKFRLTVVGETWENWTMPAEMIALSRHRERITFVNRYVSDAEASRFFANADVLVLPYRRGSASGPMHIAMSAGLPIVLYAVGGLVQDAADYAGAVLVPPGDVAALRDALLKTADHRGQRYADRHSWSKTVEAFERLAETVAQP